MIFARFTVVSAPCCTAICTRRPRGARHSRLRAAYRRRPPYRAPDRLSAKLVGEIELLIVDGPFRAQFHAAAALRVAARRGEHRRAERARQLNRRGADTARAAVNQDAFARRQPADLEDVGPDREEGLRDAGRLFHRKALRHRQALRGQAQRSTRRSRRPAPARRRAFAPGPHLPRTPCRRLPIRGSAMLPEAAGTSPGAAPRRAG